MPGNERDFVRWLTRRLHTKRRRVELGVGDDMAMVTVDGARVLVTADMLLDGVHFETDRHSLAAIGTKAIGCSLSDCAAMAVQPVAAVASLALPREFSLDEAQALTEAMASACEAYGCDLVGGDTTSWDNPLAIDVSMLAIPYPAITPVRRDGARPGDGIFVTGLLGGSLLGRHLAFTPRVCEARAIAERLGGRLHAMIDISDGLAIDLDRMTEASGAGAVLDEALVRRTASPAAYQAAHLDGQPVLEHVLHDGEDFELLLAGEVDDQSAAMLSLVRVGTIVAEAGLRMKTADGSETPLEPGGYQHLR